MTTTIEAPNTTDTTVEQGEGVTVEDFEISAELIDDPEALIEAFLERQTEWINSGATQEDVNKALESGNMDAYIDQVAAKYDALFINALLPSDWESDQTLRSFVREIL